MATTTGYVIQAVPGEDAPTLWPVEVEIPVPWPFVPISLSAAAIVRLTGDPLPSQRIVGEFFVWSGHHSETRIMPPTLYTKTGRAFYGPLCITRAVGRISCAYRSLRECQAAMDRLFETFSPSPYAYVH